MFSLFAQSISNLTFTGLFYLTSWTRTDDVEFEWLDQVETSADLLLAGFFLFAYSFLLETKLGRRVV